MAIYLKEITVFTTSMYLTIRDYRNSTGSLHNHVDTVGDVSTFQGASGYAFGLFLCGGIIMDNVLSSPHLITTAEKKILANSEFNFLIELPFGLEVSGELDVLIRKARIKATFGRGKAKATIKKIAKKLSEAELNDDITSLISMDEMVTYAGRLFRRRHDAFARACLRSMGRQPPNKFDFAMPS
eukprot:3611315-Amphidinium_carterae.1